jgi:hypothetical protein
MLYAVQLRLESPLLGDRTPDTMGVRRFQRGKNNEIHIPVSIWRSLLDQAQADIGSHYTLDSVNMPETIRVSSTQMYTRRYNRTKIDFFESVQKGASVRFDVLVRNQNIKDAPGAPGLHSLLSHIGEWIGISPWGVKFGYGRFKVVHITPIRHNEACTPTFNSMTRTSTSESDTRPASHTSSPG